MDGLALIYTEIKVKAAYTYYKYLTMLMINCIPLYGALLGCENITHIIIIS